MQTYLSLLQRWGRALNLTSSRYNSEAGFRDLFADSTCLVPHLPAGLDRLIDLGSGQGFPALAIAIETGISVELIESDRRKAAFLTTAMAALGLKGNVWTTRIEATQLPPARCVTAKALAPLPALIGLARPFLAADGFCLFLKGPRAADELPSARDDKTVRIDILPTPRPSSTIVKVSGLS